MPTKKKRKVVAVKPAENDYGLNYWGTEQELRFIRMCGTGRLSQIRTPRPVMLRRLKEAYLQRYDWGRIHRGKVMEALDKALMEYARN